MEVYIQFGDEDVYLWNIAGGAKYSNKLKIDKTDNDSTGWGQRVYVSLDRGVFCTGDGYAFMDINGIETICRPGSTWRATCPDNQN